MKRPKGTLGPVLTIAAALFVPPLAVVLIGLYFLQPAWLAWMPRWLRVGGSVAGISLPAILPYLVGLFGEIKQQLIPAGDDAYVRAARAVAVRAFGADVPSRRHVTFGHTHQQKVVGLPGGGLYVNSGTWVPLWDVGRPDLAGRARYSFVRFDLEPEGDYVTRPVLWDDEAGAGRPPVMLGPPLW